MGDRRRATSTKVNYLRLEGSGLLVKNAFRGKSRRFFIQKRLFILRVLLFH
jgi:hypothetical protein